MNCCQCEGIEREFNQKAVAKELKQYRKEGPAKPTRMLIDALKAEGVEGMTLLDIGGGIGAIQHELLSAGASRAIHVDASTAYIKAAKEETERRGLADRVTHYHGNFVELTQSIEPADVVTLDKVICCYHDIEGLVGQSSAKARKHYGLVYPSDTWWTRVLNSIFNLVQWIRRSPFRSFVHSTDAVDALVRGNGLERRFYGKRFMWGQRWQVMVYSRSNHVSPINPKTT